MENVNFSQEIQFEQREENENVQVSSKNNMQSRWVHMER